MTIAILCNADARVIVAKVPQYLADADRSSEDIAEAIFSALGLSSSECEYMIGDFSVSIDIDTLNGGKGYGSNVRRLDEYTQNFKEDVLAALEESK